MADLGGIFDATKFEEMGDFSPVPAGDYNIVIEGSERKALASGNGDKLAFTFTINGGEYDGRKLFDNLNCWHTSSEEAAQIGWKILAQITRCSGKVNITDTDELTNSNLSVRVDIESDKDNPNKKYNRIKMYSKLGDGVPAVAVAAIPETGASDSTAKMPWDK